MWQGPCTRVAAAASASDHTDSGALRSSVVTTSFQPTARRPLTAMTQRRFNREPFDVACHSTIKSTQANIKLQAETVAEAATAPIFISGISGLLDCHIKQNKPQAAPEQRYHAPHPVTFSHLEFRLVPAHLLQVRHTNVCNT